jgi:hypothetical protein
MLNERRETETAEERRREEDNTKLNEVQCSCVFDCVLFLPLMSFLIFSCFFLLSTSCLTPSSRLSKKKDIRRRIFRVP